MANEEAKKINSIPITKADLSSGALGFAKLTCQAAAIFEKHQQGLAPVFKEKDGGELELISFQITNIAERVMPTRKQSVKSEERIECMSFLLKNSWQIVDEGDHYISFGKQGYIGVDFDDCDMTFIGDSGDFLQRPIDKYTLIGVLMEHRQLPFNYNQ